MDFVKPKRQKTGGRQKGTKNKRAVKLAEKLRLLEEAAKTGDLTPLDFLLQVMRDEENDLIIRLDAAKTAAPYMHAKRAPEDSSGNPIQYNLTILKADG